MTYLTLAKPPKAFGFSCKPNRKVPIIFIHNMPPYPNFVIEELTVLCLNHDILHIALWKVSPQACEKLDNITLYGVNAQ